MQYHENQIIIADTQFLIVESLQKLLYDEFQMDKNILVSYKHELLQALSDKKAKLLIIDYNHIDFESAKEFQDMVVKPHDIGILILIDTLKKNEFIELNTAGIKNILLKTAERDEIIAGIKAAFSGKKFYCQQVLELFSEMHVNKPLLKENVNLTYSEIEIIKAIADGYTTKQIASRKFISHHTVMTHRKNIFRKLNITNASELVMFAIRTGIIDIIDYQI